MAILLQASEARGKHEVPADTHTPWALVLRGSPGPALGISERDQGWLTGGTKSLSPLTALLLPHGGAKF